MVEAQDAGLAGDDAVASKSPKELTDWQQRLLDEYNDLYTKTTKLRDFLKTETFAGLDVHQQVLLKLQLRYMQGYAGVLGERVSAFSS